MSIPAAPPHGHYLWAMACYLATVAVGTPVVLLLARGQALPFDGRTLMTALTASWALFAVNLAIQFPLLIRFGYTRTSFLTTTLPLALVSLAVIRLHLTVASIQPWLPYLWVAGAAAIVASAAVAIPADRRRMATR